MNAAERIKLRILFLGDSITVGDGDQEACGWPSRLLAQTVVPPLKAQCYNLGIGGDRISDLQARWRAEVTSRVAGRPGCGAVLMIGVNDAIRAAKEGGPFDFDAWTARFTGILDDLSKRVPVFVATPVPVHPTLRREGATGELVDQHLEGLCQRTLQAAQALDLAFCDLRLLKKDAAFMGDLAAADQLHPSSIGYARIAATIADEPSWTTFLDQCRDATPECSS